MNFDTTALLQTLVAEAGFTVSEIEQRDGLLGEDNARVVWCVEYETVPDLLEMWIEEQSWLAKLVTDKGISVEKTWELYLVLLCQGAPSLDEEPLLEAVRKDSSFARKLIIADMVRATPSRVARLLAPLRPLTIDSETRPPDALEAIEEAAVVANRTDALSVLMAFRQNRPLFGSPVED